MNFIRYLLENFCEVVPSIINDLNVKYFLSVYNDVYR